MMLYGIYKYTYHFHPIGVLWLPPLAASIPLSAESWPDGPLEVPLDEVPGDICSALLFIHSGEQGDIGTQRVCILWISGVSQCRNFEQAHVPDLCLMFKS